jgi:hypothetical protein
MVQGRQGSGDQSGMNPIAPWYQLGYIIPHRYTDLDAYQFYKVAPEGMMLVTTGLDLAEYTLASVEAQMPAFSACLDLLAQRGWTALRSAAYPWPRRWVVSGPCA